VVYASPLKQLLLSVVLRSHSNVQMAITQSNIVSHFPSLATKPLKVGIFGKKVTLETTLCDGDRVEIYRSLIIDPKEARRKRAAKIK